MIDGIVTISKSSFAEWATRGREAASVAALDSCCATAIQRWPSGVIRKRV